MEPAEVCNVVSTPIKPSAKKPAKKIHYTLDSIRELFGNEGCNVISTEYRNVLSAIEHPYEGQSYHVQLYRWIKKGSRPHLPPIPRPKLSHKKYSSDSIRDMFAEEGCVLAMPDDWVYKMNQDPITYTFEGKVYTTTINRWVNFNHRPHSPAGLCEPSEHCSQ
jgi:hypothetical protein